MFDEYDDIEYDYNNIIRDCEDLYDDEWDYEDDIEMVEQDEWENYYHNIADELVDE